MAAFLVFFTGRLLVLMVGRFIPFFSRPFALFFSLLLGEKTRIVFGQGGCPFQTFEFCSLDHIEHQLVASHLVGGGKLEIGEDTG